MSGPSEDIDSIRDRDASWNAGVIWNNSVQYASLRNTCDSQSQMIADRRALLGQVAALTAERDELRSERQREHDLRVQMAGSVEALTLKLAGAEAERLAVGCHRSHPHEDMDAACQRLTEVVRDNNRIANELAATKALLTRWLGGCGIFDTIKKDTRDFLAPPPSSEAGT